MKQENSQSWWLQVLANAMALLFCLGGWSCFLTDTQPMAAQIGSLPQPSVVKQKGAHVFGMRDTTDLEALRQQNLEWVTLVPWGFQKDVDSPSVSHHDGDSLHIQRHDNNWVKRLRFVRNAGYRVFLKPHLWLNAPTEGKWRSDIFPKNEADWAAWQQSYRSFILRYAVVAERAEVEMFCIGVEFSRLTAEKPAFWQALIQDVRAVYSGKLIYAANWYQEFETITFWDSLDYIGIQAYFPLATETCPSVAEIAAGWQAFTPALAAVSTSFDRKIVFTEIGYRSTTTSAIKPWEWSENAPDASNAYSEETQANCYQAFFDVVWPQAWFGGAHIWQLRPDYKRRRRYEIDFTPQGKLAADIIARGYKNE